MQDKFYGTGFEKYQEKNPENKTEIQHNLKVTSKSLGSQVKNILIIIYFGNVHMIIQVPSKAKLTHKVIVK